MKSLRKGPKAFFVFALLAITCGSNFYWSFTSSSRGYAVNPSSTFQQTLPPATKPILFVHFHKSGGTNACGIVKQSTLLNVTDADGKLVTISPQTEDLIGNCNTPFSSPNVDVRVFSHIQTCRHLLPYAVDQDNQPRNNFVAVEVPFQESMPCDPRTFRSFAIMRDPVTRLQSHMLAHGNWKEARITAIIRNRKPCLEFYYMDGYSIVNSMVIRQLLGRERFIDTRPVDEKDLELAKEIVDKFDAFVPMEYLQHPEVQQLLNSTIPEYIQGQARRKKKKAHKPKAYNSSEKFLQLITEENKFDILLYQYMLQKLKLDIR
jgi:hypothetical protein